MSEIFLYPTETIYGLGVNAFDKKAWSDLCVLKGRDEAQTASWLVRDMIDVERLAVVTDNARVLAKRYLPGPLTLVLQARKTVPEHCLAADGTVSFRISSDPLAQQLIAEYMRKSGGVPLTCTSANVHGAPTPSMVEEILRQFGERSEMVTKVIDGGVRIGTPSTIVRCVGEWVEVLRQGAVTL
jgi:tRNA threonylcarbamoyl adenosine modification protein (Sua5/YciO/YrdC/YwlC family)